MKMDYQTLLIKTLTLLLCLSSWAKAEETAVLAPSLEVAPQRCVALHQGQVCYQQAQFTWQAPQAARYCLFSSASSQALQCWTHADGGEYLLDFQSPQSLTFRLRHMDKKQDLVQTQLTVAWVYGNQKRRRTSWRLF